MLFISFAGLVALVSPMLLLAYTDYNAGIGGRELFLASRGGLERESLRTSAWMDNENNEKAQPL